MLAKNITKLSQQFSLILSCRALSCWAFSDEYFPLQVKREVVLHEGHRDFNIHSWDAQLHKITIPVRVVHFGHHHGHHHGHRHGQHQNVEHHHGHHGHHNHQHHLTEENSANHTEVGLETLLKGHEGNLQPHL